MRFAKLVVFLRQISHKIPYYTNSIVSIFESDHAKRFSFRRPNLVDDYIGGVGGVGNTWFGLAFCVHENT